MTDILFYLQDKRQFVGNDMLFWAKDRQGYTTDLNKAHVFTKAEAVAQNQSRETDIPWPKDYIDNKWRPAVDFQRVNIKDALKDTDIELYKPKPVKALNEKCWDCGRFLTKIQYYTGCPNCENKQ